VRVRKGSFDERLGADFLERVPQQPGVYEWLAADGATVYVGKAKNLRKRLGQYRRASRRKATRKRWEIVRASASLRLRTCGSELDALLLETELIQRLRPPLNVSGAFEFLYPCIGLRRGAADLDLVCTTSPDGFAGFTFSGAFRSPKLTRAAFASLVELLGHLGHVEPSRRVKDVPKLPFSRVVRLRRLATTWDAVLLQFLRGAGDAALQALCLALVERPSARTIAHETQRHLALLQRFSEEECEPLRSVLARTGRADTFLPQRERDAAFLIARLGPGASAR
jgi:predicted GIY-YIG superfamily endonuclease